MTKDEAINEFQSLAWEIIKDPTDKQKLHDHWFEAMRDLQLHWPDLWEHCALWKMPTKFSTIKRWANDCQHEPTKRQMELRLWKNENIHI